MDKIRAVYDEVYVYTMDRPGFILQHVADAFAVQTAVQSESEASKPIAVVFGLVGLYLRVVKRYSGRQVQQVHTELARKKRTWPTLPLPEHRGAITILDVHAAPAGPERDAAIDDWCKSVWDACGACHQTIIDLLQEH